MSDLKIYDTPLQGLKVIERFRHGDERGFLSRLFCGEELEAANWKSTIAQINHTNTAGKGTVRGMHFQYPPHAEMKLVTCIKGEIWDVAVDVRFGSPAFLQWHAEILSADNCRALLIPEGFAHGFQTLAEDVDLIYLHTACYRQEAEDGICPLDSHLGISWPLPITMMSNRDRNFSPLEHGYTGVAI